MTQQYRTLGEGDRRLPGCEYDEGRQGRWKPCHPYMIGERISRVDADAAAYRVPCSATVAPDGYEVVDRARLPQGARVGATWLYWRAPHGQWQRTQAAGVLLRCGNGDIYAAPADELAALYAQGDAAREQPATAPASPCPCCGERDRLVAENAELRRDRDALREIVEASNPEQNVLALLDLYHEREAAAIRERDDARAEVAEVRRAWDATVEARDDALAELERLRGELHRITAAVNEMIRGSYEAGLAVLAAARAALEGRDG